jgi:L-malate glycosyltransferase
MKILYLLEGSAFAGAESYAMNLIRALARLEDIHIYCALFYDGPLKEKLVKEGIPVVQLYGRNNLHSALCIVRYVRRHRIDIVHMVDLKSTIVGGFARLFMRNALTVATVHGLPEHYKTLLKQLKYGVSLTLYYLVLKLLVDRVICVSSDLRSRLQKIIKVGKIQAIHNGLVVKSIAGIPAPPRSRGEFVVGTIGRLETVKGYAFLLEAARKVLEKKDAVVFHIVGSGPLEEQLKRCAALEGIAHRVVFWGFQPDVSTFIQNMDLFVLSSLHEGIPYALLEAMSFCKPVVCTNVGGIKEVIRDRIDGLLVPSEDAAALSRAILEILENDAYARLLAANARKKVEMHFSSELMGRQTCALYDRLMQTPRSGQKGGRMIS